ncbi:MAG: hypothetical protein ACXW2F_05555 [Thermoanaerobaculia bacterium]
MSVAVIEKTPVGWRGRHIALDDRSVGGLKQRMNQLSRPATDDERATTL